MSETALAEAPDEIGTSPLFIAPAPEDSKPRTVAKPTAPKPGALPVDPEAPFGWMKDPTAPGGRRPKKAPGRQAAADAGAPKHRPAAATRAKKAPELNEAPPVPARTYAQKIADVAGSVWMMTNVIPEPEGDVLVMGRPIAPLVTRTKASGMVLREQTPSLIASVGVMAEHSKTVRAGIDYFAGEDGAGWLIPAIFAGLPLVMAMTAIWKKPIETHAAPIAARSAALWAQTVAEMMPEQETTPVLALEAATAGEPPAQ